MILEIKVPSPGESITEVEVGSWLVENGSVVDKDQEIAEIESDKATLTVSASDSGKIEFKAEEGDTLEVGQVFCVIDTSAEPSEQKIKSEIKQEEKDKDLHQQKRDSKAEVRNKPEIVETEERKDEKISSDYEKVKVTAVAKEMMKEHGLSVDDVIKGLKRLGKKEVESAIQAKFEPTFEITNNRWGTRETDRARMSSLRRKLSQRLVSVKNETAMLTTFNEVDMTAVITMRKKYQQQFIEKHGFKLGFMSFFTKAVAIAMDFHPMVNAQIDGDEIITPQFVDIGIAVSTPKGLMVPIVRNAESKSIPQIELEIKDLAEKARNKKISVDELSGGTFTITNGGVFGSLLSTPILNPPQSGILGMHNIVERPIAIEGQVVIRPMMYVALSYDHRIVDGKDSVGFLVKLKELIENTERMFTNGNDAGKLLLEL